MTTGSHLKIEPWGTNSAGVRLLGDPRKPEHAEFNVAFPGGMASVVRTTDGEYWVHVHVSRPGAGGYDPDKDVGGRIVDARLDIVGRHASDSNLGDFNDPDLYHLAVRVTREGNGA